jgi:predicted nucleic acid-binding protein
VLDAYALLAYFFDEPGGERVRSLIEQSSRGSGELYTCVINFAETLYWTQRRRGTIAFSEVADGLPALPVRLVDIDQELSIEAARLKAGNPLVLADCYAAALALRLEATLVTGGAEFREFEPELAIERLGGPETFAAK